MTDPLDRQPSIRQEFENSDGSLPCKIDIPSSLGHAKEEAHATRVCYCGLAKLEFHLTSSRFMSDKIMPLSQAVEGYEIFDNMKAQKVVFQADK